jgi:hypothetical protein
MPTSSKANIIISPIGKKRLPLLRGHPRTRRPDGKGNLDSMGTVNLRWTIGLSSIPGPNSLKGSEAMGRTSSSTGTRRMANMPRRSEPGNPARMAKWSS